jgi:hypothetical protein
VLQEIKHVNVHSQKQLHRITSDLIGNKREVVLPSYQNENDLSNRFWRVCRLLIQVESCRFLPIVQLTLGWSQDLIFFVSHQLNQICRYNIKTSTFFAEWSEFLDQIAVSNDDIVLTGDLNFHLDNPSNNKRCFKQD